MPECYECGDEIEDGDSYEELLSGEWDAGERGIEHEYTRRFCSTSCLRDWVN